MGFASGIYNGIFKKSSTFALSIVVGAFVFEAAIDDVSYMIFESVNKGKLWHHIKDNYTEKSSN